MSEIEAAGKIRACEKIYRQKKSTLQPVCFLFTIWIYMIEVQNLKKTYSSAAGNVEALSSISFRIQEGEIFGLLGPNGAGKTTTIKILTHLTKFDSGNVTIDGLNLYKHREAIKRISGIVPQETNLERELSIYENLLIHALFFSIPEKESRIESALNEVGLLEKKRVSVHTLSGGMKRRLLLARALLTEPSILYLDEPSIGLDPQIRWQIWDIIRKIVNRGCKVLLTTHYIEEAEALCHRVGILSRGKLVACDTPTNLKKKYGEMAVEHINPSGERNLILCKNRSDAAKQLSKLARNRENNVSLRPINLEDVFLELTGRRLE